MPSDHARRGRPRGSGLDDRALLRRIAQKLEADATLRPTTAIKALGITDPSTIRRLRDKLKTSPSPAAPSSVAARASSASSAPRASVVRLEASPVGKPAASPHAPATPAPGLAETGPKSNSSDQFAWLMPWYAFGLSALSSAVEAQRAVWGDLFQAPQVASALRQQILFNEVAKALCPKRPDIRSTLH